MKPRVDCGKYVLLIGKGPSSVYLGRFASLEEAKLEHSYQKFLYIRDGQRMLLDRCKNVGLSRKEAIAALNMHCPPL